jgi:hypothetical protein
MEMAMFIKDMLREELENSLQIKEDYKQAVAKLPRGALVKKIIGGHPYYYLAHREGAKVKFDYQGKLSEKEVLGYEGARLSRSRYRKRLSEVNKQIKFLKKVLRAKSAV